MRVLTKDELLNLMAGLPPSVMAMDEEETITTLAATVIEQQAEIERLRQIVRTVFARHRAQIDEPLYTAIVMEIDQ